MPEHRGIQNRIDAGRGKAAIRLGQPYNIYRVQNNAATNWADAANLIGSSIKVYRRTLTSQVKLESKMRMGTYWYDLIGDMRPWYLGDLFIQNDPGWGPNETLVAFPTWQFNGFVLTFHGPVKKAIGARVDRYAQFYRPATVPDVNSYWRSTLDNASPLILTNGFYALGSAGSTAGLIPVGFMPIEKTHGSDIFEIAQGMTPKIRWLCYVPPIPVSAQTGYRIAEGDRLVLQDGSRYVVLMAWNQEAGSVGSQLVLERETSQA